MNRTSLERALQRLSAEAGYAFHTASEEYMARQIASLPAAWLAPLKLIEIDGRKHGRAVYALTLHLLESGGPLPPARRQELWAAMERRAPAISSALSDEREVIAVENLTLQPRTFAFTNHGEISLSAEARIVTWF